MFSALASIKTKIAKISRKTPEIDISVLSIVNTQISQLGKKCKNHEGQLPHKFFTIHFNCNYNVLFLF